MKTFIFIFTILLTHFTFSAPQTEVKEEVKISHIQLTEAQKIEQLIVSMEQLQNAKFWRNGTFYSAKIAGDHLRMKVRKIGVEHLTAKSFIKKIASESYLSGLDYKIKMNDGHVIASKEFFYEELKKIEN